MAGILYGVKPGDWITFTAVAMLLLVVALVACSVPARRAMRVDPDRGAAVRVADSLCGDLIRSIGGGVEDDLERGDVRGLGVAVHEEAAAVFGDIVGEEIGGRNLGAAVALK